MDGSSREFVCSEQIVAAVYQNIDGDEPWAKALEELRLALGANHTVLRIVPRAGKQRETHITSGANVNAESVAEWEDCFARQGYPCRPRYGEAVTFNWRDLVPLNPVFAGLVTAGCSWTLAYSFESSAEGECMLIASRDDSKPSFSIPEKELIMAAGLHFQRAFRLRLQILNGRLVSDFQAAALDRLAIAGFMVNESRCTLPLNPRASLFIEERNGLKISNGMLHAINEQDDRSLQAAIRSILGQQENAAGIRGLSIRRASGKRDIGVVVSAQEFRCPRSGRQERVALIFVRDPQSVSDPSISLMQQLFAFTRTEALVAVRLAKGLRLEDIEQELNIRHNTARAHLRSMFSKAEVHRQSQLVHLLANCVAGLGEMKGKSEHNAAAEVAAVSPSPSSRRTSLSASRFQEAVTHL